MRVRFSPQLLFPSRLPFIILVALFCVLLVAGGSSRADAPGQVIAQTASVLAMILALLLGPAPSFSSTKPVWLILLAAIALGIIQLIPLPPAIWQSLPGRGPFSQAAAIIGEPQPWRPISLVPGATINAISSLLVPLAVLLLLAQFREADRKLMPGMFLSLIVANMLVGLIQFSGLHLTTPFADNGARDVSGLLANRNHFALLMAIGCVISPTWAFLGDRRNDLRAPVALGLVLLFVLSILASGSRAGLIVGSLALIAGLTIARQGIKRSLARYPRWVFPAVISTILFVVGGFALTSFFADRAISINRLLAMDPAQDLRTQAFPHVLRMVETYFPFGSGLGSFDPIYRVHEPLDLLNETYFNHAHNDILEIALDGGLFGLLVLFGAMLWWSKATFVMFQTAAEIRNALPKVGSTIIFLTLVASIADYPSRTPIMMAMLAVAAAWLTGIKPALSPSLPQSSRLL